MYVKELGTGVSFDVGLIGFTFARVWDRETDVLVETTFFVVVDVSDNESLASLYPREFLGFLLDFFSTLSKETFFDAFL